MPDATLHGLVGRRGLRVWTEMFSDSVLALERAGALDRDGAAHGVVPVRLARAAAWVDGNERVADASRTEVTNSPALIARNPAMISVNTALQVDLFAPGQRLAGSTPGSTPASAARPTSSSAPCTATAARRSSPCGRGTRRPTARRSCRWSTSR